MPRAARAVRGAPPGRRDDGAGRIRGGGRRLPAAAGAHARVQPRPAARLHHLGRRRAGGVPALGRRGRPGAEAVGAGPVDRRGAAGRRPRRAGRRGAAGRLLRERTRERSSGIVAYAADEAGAVAALAYGGRAYLADLAAGGVRELAVAGPATDPRPDPAGRDRKSTR